MNPITIPFEIFALSFGVPCLIVLCLVGWLLCKIKNPNKNAFADRYVEQMQERPSSPEKFHSELLHQQIDMIFNGLNTIVETERLKIKALLGTNHNMPFQFQAEHSSMESPRSMDLQQFSHSMDMNTFIQEQQNQTAILSQDVSDHFDDNEELSQSEIELAKKMQDARKNKAGKKLAAVA